jgi:hypothetical protein
VLRQKGDVLPQEIRSDQRMAVDPNYYFAPRLGYCEVQSGRNDSCGIIDDKQALTPRLNLLQDLPRPIVRLAVRHNNLKAIRRVILRQHCL